MYAGRPTSDNTDKYLATYFIFSNMRKICWIFIGKDKSAPFKSWQFSNLSPNCKWFLSNRSDEYPPTWYVNRPDRRQILCSPKQVNLKYCAPVNLRWVHRAVCTTKYTHKTMCTKLAVDTKPTKAWRELHTFTAACREKCTDQKLFCKWEHFLIIQQYFWQVVCRSTFPYCKM